MADTPDLSPTPAQVAQTALLASWLEGLPEPHILFDRGYRIVAANGAYRRQFGQGAPVVGRTCHAVSHHSPVPCDQAGETCPLARSLFSGQRERVLHLHHTPAGEEYVQIELVPLRDEAGQPQYFLEKMEPLRIAQGQPGAPGMIGRAPAFQAVLELIARVGPSQASVLLLGESGTGKELAARAVHEASPRAGRPLVVVDCASLPETLFESELFGHERGAFTGAHAARAGLVEAAHGGTLFLDEVGDIPLTMQVKLLRLLESGTYRRVGHTELRRADIRLVAATHRDLRAMVREGRFRQDLYYRLSTFPIQLPALRERPQDIPLLAESLLQRVAGGRGLVLAPAALRRLAQHPFPGNVRELRNVLERAALLTDGAVVTAHTIERALSFDAPAAAPARAAQQPDHATLRDIESEALRAALAGGPRRVANWHAPWGSARARCTASCDCYGSRADAPCLIAFSACCGWLAVCFCLKQPPPRVGATFWAHSARGGISICLPPKGGPRRIRRFPEERCSARRPGPHRRLARGGVRLGPTAACSRACTNGAHLMCLFLLSR